MDAKIIAVPENRVTAVNDTMINSQGDYVIYWMTAQRRCYWNFALQQALWWCQELKKPLVMQRM